MKSIRRTKITVKPSEGGTKDAQGLGARAVSVHSLRGNLVSETVHENDAGDDWLPPKVLLKPQNQLALTDLELDEELTRILNANNPHAPQNISRYSVKEGTYKTVSNLDHLVLHYEFDGYMVYRNIDDANISTTSTGTSTDPTSSESPAKSLEDGGGPDRLGTAVSGAEGGSGEAASGEGEGTAVFDETAAGKAKKGPQRNQFNFSERASQTINNPHRVRSTNTEPPPQRTFSHGVNQWTIYDAYCDDLLLKEKSAKEKAKSQPVAGKGHRDEDKQAVLPSDGQHTSEDVYWKNPEFKKSIVIVERMANQNTYDEITHDYKYWEDASDEFREGKSGTLLPLWKFQFEKDKKKQITGLCWNRFKPDLFAVSYGSYDFSRQGPGLVACFSFKNPSFPEFIYSTDSGVMCIDFHPTIPSLLAAGLYDGTVLVFDLRKGGKEGSPGNSFCAVSYGSGSSATLAPAPAPNAGTGVGAGTGAGAAGGGGAQKGGAAGVGGAGGGTVGASLANGAEKRGEPVFRSGARSGKHTDPVWQVAWQPDNLDGNSNFFSVSGDGRVTQWTLVKNELVHTDVIRLHLSESTFRPPASLQDRNLIGGMIGMNEDVFNSASSTVAQAAQAIVDDDDKRLFKVAGGSCFDFHRTEPHLFIVGTEEGQIHKCSTAYSNQFMLSFEGHKMGVYQVRYNPFWSEVFLSASADWTLKLWHHGKSKPLMTFDLSASVGDVAWSPYSSTVFAAITSDGKVYVYDLDVNKNEPLCDQPIVHKAKLTHISFSITDPVVLVGDDKGAVTSLKLSPNLRKVREKDPAEQVEKLQKVLAPSMSTGAEVGV